jgi:hypothetical protein
MANFRPIIKIKLDECLKGYPFAAGQIKPFTESGIQTLNEAVAHELGLRDAELVSTETVEDRILFTIKDTKENVTKVCTLTPFPFERKLETKTQWN